jgi:hypothetical protein
MTISNDELHWERMLTLLNTLSRYGYSGVVPIRLHHGRLSRSALDVLRELVAAYEHEEQTCPTNSQT